MRARSFLAGSRTIPLHRRRRPGLQPQHARWRLGPSAGCGVSRRPSGLPIAAIPFEARPRGGRRPSARRPRPAGPVRRNEREDAHVGKTLITGGSGYIGALLVERAARARPRGARAGLAAPRPGGHRRRAGAGRRRGDPRRHPRRRRPRAGARRAPRRSSTSPRSSATRRARSIPRTRTRSTSQATARARRRRERGGRAAAGVRLDVLELRAHGRPDRADHRGRRAAPGVAVRRAEGRHGAADPGRRRRQRPSPTCLRFATVYGVGRRMRFDLTVNEFTRELWADRELEVFGEQFWRPYIHVARRGRARCARCSTRPWRRSRGKVFNAGPLGRELPQARPRRGDRQADRPRQGHLRPARRGPARLQGQLRQDRRELGFETLMTVPDGIAEIIAALDAGPLRRSVRRALQEHPVSVDRRTIPMAVAPRPSRPAALRPAAAAAGPRGGGRDAALGLADARPAHGGVRARRSPSTSARATRSRVSSCTAALHLAYLAAGVGPGRRGDRARRSRSRPPPPPWSTAARRRCSPRSSRASDPSLDPEDVERRITPRTKAVCVVHYAGYAAAADRLQELCDEHGIALIEDVAHAPERDARRPQARHLGPGGRVQLLLQQGALRRRGRPAVHRRRRGRRVRALAALALR